MKSAKYAGSCGHYELVKIRGKWHCAKCGQAFTIPQSIQHFIELSDVLKSAITTGRPLSETLDELVGRKEWDKMLATMPNSYKRRITEIRK